jgi:hypothetical protein
MILGFSDDNLRSLISECVLKSTWKVLKNEFEKLPFNLIGVNPFEGGARLSWRLVDSFGNMSAYPFFKQTLSPFTTIKGASYLTKKSSRRVSTKTLKISRSTSIVEWREVGRSSPRVAKLY